MKKQSAFSQQLLWIFMIAVIAGVIVAVIYTNRTLRSIEKTIPGTLLRELNGLSLVLDRLSDTVTAARETRRHPVPEAFHHLRERLEAVYVQMVNLRESYVFDNLINASRFHAVVMPAIADLRIWLSDGVSGFGPETSTTAVIAFDRINEAFQKARTLTHRSSMKAQEILDVQRQRLDRFLSSVNILFALTILITFSMVVLLMIQYGLMKRESAAQKNLREHQDLLNSLFDTMPLGIALCDEEGRVILVNQGFAWITGYTADDIETLESWFRLLYPDPDYRQQVREEWASAMTRETAIREFVITCSNGKKKDIEFRGTFLSGKRLLLTMADISDRKQAEAIRRESLEIRARSRKMESLGLLAGGVAHDLNNILSGIVSYPELLLRHIPQDSRLRKPILTIQESGQRASAVVQDLLTVARGVATTKAVVNLNDLVGEYLESPEFDNLLKVNPVVRVKTDLARNLLNISASKIHISKVIMNLVLNAAEAIEEKGSIFLATANRCLDRPLRGYDAVSPGEYAVLSVSDEGSGITPGDLERIFEPFYTKKMMGRSGTGLGLAVVWNVVQDHGGYIDVTSQDNLTTFDIYFPATDEGGVECLSDWTIDDFKGNKETVLVIDDLESQREIASEMLEELGYSPIAVPSGEAAVEYLEHHDADLLVLDMIMDPGLSGRETYRRIAAMKPGQKAIIASGYAETEDVRRTQEMGAGAFIRKPFTLETLGRAVRKELDRGFLESSG